MQLEGTRIISRCQQTVSFIGAAVHLVQDCTHDQILPRYKALELSRPMVKSPKWPR
jgi:hypothetical protein